MYFYGLVKLLPKDHQSSFDVCNMEIAPMT